jgi:uncharacterized NAD-dependent epimerase/dehydratase family protein
MVSTRLQQQAHPALHLQHLGLGGVVEAVGRYHVAVAQYLQAARITNRGVALAGVSINSSSLNDAAWAEYRDRVQHELGVPVCDPMRGGMDPIVYRVLGVQ